MSTAADHQMEHHAPPTEPAVPQGDHTESPTTGRRRTVTLALFGLLALVGLIWAYHRWSYGRAHESTDDAQVDGHVVPVLARVGGYVTHVAAEENEHVPSGALLVRIDSAEYAVKLAQAEADLAAAEAAVSSGGQPGQAQALVATAANQRLALDAQIAAAQADLRQADADLARVSSLAAQEIVSRQQLDAARTRRDAAAAALTAVQRQAGAASSTVNSARAGVRLAEARLQAARAARDNARLQLSYTVLRAPTAGFVARRQAEPGQLVQPGQPLLSIVADTGVFVTANFKETQLERLHTGEPVALDVDAYGGCAARGTVASLSAATGARFALLPPDNATGNFTKVVQRVPVRIAVTQGCGDRQPLRPGMSVVVHVETR